jgi:hypothetical protein
VPQTADVPAYMAFQNGGRVGLRIEARG